MTARIRNFIILFAVLFVYHHIFSLCLSVCPFSALTEFLLVPLTGFPYYYYCYCYYDTLYLFPSLFIIFVINPFLFRNYVLATSAAATNMRLGTFSSNLFSHHCLILHCSPAVDRCCLSVLRVLATMLLFFLHQTKLWGRSPLSLSLSLPFLCMYSRRLHTSYSKLQVRRYWRVGTHMGHQLCEGDRGTTFGHSEGINQLKQGTYKLYISEDDSLCNVPQGSCTCTGGVGEPSHPRCTGVMPPRFHLITQSTDGIIYERRDLTGMGSLTGLLHEAAVSDPPLAFFWIDTSGVPQPEDLSALFEFVNVNPYTEWRWRALAAASIRNDSGDCPPSNGVDGATNELAQEDADSYYDNATELDCLRAFVEEQYVQLRITVLQAQSAMPCCLRSAGNGEIGGKVEGPGKHQQQQPRNLRANLFDACESGALTSVQALCFRNGVVTWRPQPAIEGWEYISHRLIRRLQDASGGEDIKPQNLLSTSLFALTMLDELYMAFLPDITVVNNEVDEIESMLPLVRQRPSDQADVLRRVQLLRRNLSVHRRILMSKVTVLELLNRPTVRVLLSFMNTSTTSKLDTVVRYASSYVDIARHILPTLFKLDNARRVLTNSIIIYSSGASATNNCNSNKSDTLNVTLGYVALISIPPTIVASQWALEFHVPWRAGDSTTQFWAMVGVMGACMLMVLVYPVYCWIRGRPDKFVFH